MAELPSVNLTEIEKMKVIASGSQDGAVFMLNLNKYRDAAEHPTGKLYQAYMEVLGQLLKEVDGKILWRTEVFGQVVGNQDIDEVLGIWYPSYQAFLNLMTAPSSAKNMKLRDEAVAKADLHRCEDYTKS
jgi:uncharacterized protein (DUF1330 family)